MGPIEYDPRRLAYSRQGAVERCLRWRAMIQEGDRVVNGRLYTTDFMRMLLRREQQSLLKMRIWRETGEYPAEH